MSQKSWEKIVTAVALEAAQGLRRLATPNPENDRIKTAIGRAARRAGLSYWRAYDLWYGKARRVDATELIAIRAAQRSKSKEAQNDLLALAADFTALAERASRADPEMAGPWSDAMREIASRARALADGDK